MENMFDLKRKVIDIYKSPMKVVAYLRLSREDGDGESSSISNQRRIITKFAKDRGFVIIFLRWLTMVMKEGTKSIYFRIPEQLKLRIEMEAVRQGRSVNNLLKHIVEEYLKEQKKIGNTD